MVPLDASGFTASIVGTVVFAVVTVVMLLIGYDGQWVVVLGTCTGLGLPLILVTYLHRRRAHRRTASNAGNEGTVKAGAPAQGPSDGYRSG